MSHSAEQANVKAELEAQEWYDLTPVEKKLIAYSLSLGVGLLVVFIFVFGVFK